MEKEDFDKEIEKKDILTILSSTDVANASCEELRELCQHMQDQMKKRYNFLVGEWVGARRAKNTRNGKFVSKDDVIKYLENS